MCEDCICTLGRGGVGRGIFAGASVRLDVRKGFHLAMRKLAILAPYNAPAVAVELEALWGGWMDGCLCDGGRGYSLAEWTEATAKTLYAPRRTRRVKRSRMFSVSEGVVGVTVRMLRWILQTCVTQMQGASKMREKRRVRVGILHKIGGRGRFEGKREEVGRQCKVGTSHTFSDALFVFECFSVLNSEPSVCSSEKGCESWGVQ